MTMNLLDADHTTHTSDHAPDEETKAEMEEGIAILPIRNMVAFPRMKVPFMVSLKSSAVIEDAMKANHRVGLLTSRNPDTDEPAPAELYEVGTMADIVHAHKGDDGALVVLLKGLHRFRVASWQRGGSYLKAAVVRVPEIVESDLEAEALERQVRDMLGKVMALMPELSREAAKAVLAIKDALQLTYVATFNLDVDTAARQALLEKDSLKEKMRDLLSMLAHEKDMLVMGQKIQDQVRRKMDKSKRDFMLRQQLAAIKKELGEGDETPEEVDDYGRRIDDAAMPAEALEQARREVERLEQMSPQSAEYPMIKTYLDWLVELPWARTSADNGDVAEARRILDEDHHGLEEVKERLIEFMAVRGLMTRRASTNADHDAASSAGVILCLTGPPGVGKTSLGRSVARALGRRFTRMSLGGVRDEAEIRGHRRTYIGAMPGRIIQAIKRAGTRNPVFMLDEIDKVGQDWRGDPSSALLEVLDPAQNSAFRDHYLDVDFDLSEVIFIATANQVDTIPAPLRDRMEMIPIDGYTEYEKLQIAKGHLIPRQIEAHGLREDEVTFIDEAVLKVIRDYTRESGVRQLERHLAAICRKAIVQLNEQDWSHVVVTIKMVRSYLKKERFLSETSETINMPGIATGLAVTSVGGDILYIEATRMPGKGRLTLTGQLGAVMRESAEIAFSYVRAKARDLDVDPQDFAHTDVHLHVPAGALPKDGPSAGVAMVLALASLFTRRPVRSDVGITGEITLRGRVLPVGGIKMKVLAAHRSGLTTVVLPKRNERDLEDLPDEVRDAMTFIPVEHMDGILTQALQSESPPSSRTEEDEGKTGACHGGCYAQPQAQVVRQALGGT